MTGTVISLSIILLIAIVAWVIHSQKGLGSGTDGYIGDSDSEPKILQETDEFIGSTQYSIDNKNGFVRLKPSVSLYDGNRFSCSIIFLVKQFQNLDSVTIKIDDDTRSFYAQETRRVSMNSSSTYGMLNSNVYSSYTTNNTYSSEFFLADISKDDILFLAKLAKCQTARIRFLGAEFKDFDIGKFEKKSIIKIINLVNDLVKKGYKFYDDANAKYEVTKEQNTLVHVAAQEPKLPKFKNDVEVNTYFKKLENKVNQGTANKQEQWELQTYKRLLVNHVNNLKKR